MHSKNEKSVAMDKTRQMSLIRSKAKVNAITNIGSSQDIRLWARKMKGRNGALDEGAVKLTDKHAPNGH